MAVGVEERIERERQEQRAAIPLLRLPALEGGADLLHAGRVVAVHGRDGLLEGHGYLLEGELVMLTRDHRVEVIDGELVIELVEKPAPFFGHEELLRVAGLVDGLLFRALLLFAPCQLHESPLPPAPDVFQDDPVEPSLWLGNLAATLAPTFKRGEEHVLGEITAIPARDLVPAKRRRDANNGPAPPSPGNPSTTTFPPHAGRAAVITTRLQAKTRIGWTYHRSRGA